MGESNKHHHINIMSIERLEYLVTTSRKDQVLEWVFNNLDYSIYEHLCFITGDAD